jgi:LacI family transcriptional regulator
MRKEEKKTRSPTIYDVAKAAQVSTATVSNVLRGTHYVRPDLHKRVLDASAVLGYSPNRTASNLRERRSRTIGVVVPDITVGLFNEIVRRVEQRAACTDYQIVLADSHEDFSSERERILALIRRQIDGLIVVPCRDNSPVLEELRKREIPTVLLDRIGSDTDFDSVSADNAAATREGTRHLISLGHRRITLLASDPNLRNIHERIQGYYEALEEAGLYDFKDVLVVGHNSSADAVKPLLKPHLLNESRPSALFALTQTITLGALKTIWEVGFDLPKDVSLIAYDDYEWFTALRPMLTTINQPADTFADEAWSMLMARLNNDRSPTLSAEVHCRLVIRESTAPNRAEPVKETEPTMLRSPRTKRKDTRQAPTPMRVGNECNSSEKSLINETFLQA